MVLSSSGHFFASDELRDYASISITMKQKTELLIRIPFYIINIRAALALLKKQLKKKETGRFL